MSLNPYINNDLVKGQIEDWHAIVEGERTARLLDTGPKQPSWPLASWSRRVVAIAGSAIGAMRRRHSARPVV